MGRLLALGKVRLHEPQRQALQQQQQMVSRARLPLNPRTCRQICVVERMSDGAAADPYDRRADMVMRHNVKQWLDWHNLNFHPRLAQDAVDVVPDWTADVL